ncbi:hypothetical protein MBLNU230_g6410t1 [Neophaeotheca triangularis]
MRREKNQDALTPPTSLADEEALSNDLRQVETNNARPSCFNSTTQEILFVLTATMAVAMTSFVTGTITVISSFVGEDLDMTTAQITWMSSAASLSSGAFLLFFGKIADLFGRKLLFVGSLFLFAVFCLAAGFSQDAMTIDILHGVLGLFSASAVPPAVGALGVIYEKPSKRKNWAFACFSAGNPLGFVFGTIFSGVASDIFNWRASFYLLAIIYLVFTIAAVFTVPRDFTPKEPFNVDTLKRFDIMGTLLTIGGIGMFSAALSLGDTAANGWATDYVLALLIVGVLLIVGFVFWEIYFPYPLIPMRIWRDKNFSLVLAILMLGFMAFTPATFFLALYFQDVGNMSALMVAVHLLPMAIVGIIVNAIAGLILHRVSNKLLLYIGTICYTIAFLLIAVNRRSNSYWSLAFPSLILNVIGADLEFNVANMYVMSSMPPNQQSIAGGIFQTTTKFCTTLGLGVATALFNSIQQNPSLADFWDRETQPYSVTFWFATACVALSICLVPFVTITTQGGQEKGEDSASDANSQAEDGLPPAVPPMPDVHRVEEKAGTLETSTKMAPPTGGL